MASADYMCVKKKGEKDFPVLRTAIKTRTGVVHLYKKEILMTVASNGIGKIGPGRKNNKNYKQKWEEK